MKRYSVYLDDKEIESFNKLFNFVALSCFIRNCIKKAIYNKEFVYEIMGVDK